MNTRTTAAALQHAIQYPSGHLDRFASFGPQFEMTEDRSPIAPVTPTAITTEIVEMSKEFDAKRFVIGGKAIFTLQGLQARYTYKVSVSDDGKCYFVALLTGPDNLSDYTYLGILQVNDGSVRLTRKSRYTDQSQPVVALRWALGRIWRGVAIDPARIYHAGRCGRCGRALTVPASVESGFGPECLGRLGE